MANSSNNVYQYKGKLLGTNLFQQREHMVETSTKLFVISSWYTDNLPLYDGAN